MRSQRVDVELRACGDGSDQAGRSGRAKGIAVSTFKPDPGEMRSVSEPPAASARDLHQASRTTIDRALRIHLTLPVLAAACTGLFGLAIGLALFYAPED